MVILPTFILVLMIIVLVIALFFVLFFVWFFFVNFHYYHPLIFPRPDITIPVRSSSEVTW